MPDYYKILGLNKYASQQEIKAAYRRLAFKYHPDKNPGNPDSNTTFILIQKAYDVLSDPVSKERYDNGIFYELSHENTMHRARRRPPPHFYAHAATRQKISYSRKDYILATVVVALIIIIAVAFPVYMLQRSSQNFYEKAIMNYATGRYYTALQNVDLSIQIMSTTNAEACTLASVILVHKLKKYDFAQRYIKKGLEYEPTDSLMSELHYLDGLCFAEMKKPKLAVAEFKKVKNYSNAYDSSLFRTATIYALQLDSADTAYALLNKLTVRNPRFYKAYYFQGIILERQEKYHRSYDVFRQLTKRPLLRAASLYHLAKAEIELNMPDSACIHLKEASKYNLIEAKQLMNLYCKHESIFLSPYD